MHIHTELNAQKASWKAMRFQIAKDFLDPKSHQDLQDQPGPIGCCAWVWIIQKLPKIFKASAFHQSHHRMNFQIIIIVLVPFVRTDWEQMSI